MVFLCIRHEPGLFCEENVILLSFFALFRLQPLLLLNATVECLHIPWFRKSLRDGTYFFSLGTDFQPEG